MTRLLVAETFVLLALSALALDLYAHHRVETLGGVNVWGYRGAVARHKAPDEIRVALIGGTRPRVFLIGEKRSGASAAPGS